MTKRLHRWAVFVSGQGTNLENLLRLENEELKSNHVALVFADRPCRALEIAKKFGKKTLLLNPREDGFTNLLLQSLKENQVNSIFLLGYMRMLPSKFLSAWKE